MELLLNTIGSWLDTYSWLLPATTMFCFLIIGLATYLNGCMKLKQALLFEGVLGIFMIGYIYATDYLIAIGFLA